jgi:hypothetical protein
MMTTLPIVTTLPAFPEVRAEPEGVERAGHRMGEPVHPPGQETTRVGKRSLDPQVAAPGPVDGPAELGVGGGTEQGHQAVEDEHQEQSRAGDPGRDAGEDEYPGADHRADADHRDVDEPHLAAQADFKRHVARASRNAPDGEAAEA